MKIFIDIPKEEGVLYYLFFCLVVVLFLPIVFPETNGDFGLLTLPGILTVYLLGMGGILVWLWYLKKKSEEDQEAEEPPDTVVVEFTREEALARLGDISAMCDLLYERIDGDIYPEYVRVHEQAKRKIRKALEWKE